MKKIFLILLVLGIAIAWIVNFLNPGMIEETTLMQLKEKYPKKESAVADHLSAAVFLAFDLHLL